tara:strand:- start:14259 stop:14576 length:318 start_codon:yes stop_codon:yes gene_type:complete
MATRDDRFNDLYAIVTEEYENWDEGRTVDWRKVEVAMQRLMVKSNSLWSPIYSNIQLNEVQKTLLMIYRCQEEQAIKWAENPDTTIEELKESLVGSLETELEMNE